MRSIKSKGMKPELKVRKLVYSLGYRYRLHPGDLPGKPDLAFIGRRKAIFVHGCFWHQHSTCREGRMPGSNLGYWKPKLEGNIERDRKNERRLRDAGWTVLTIWECETGDLNQVASRIREFIES